MIIIASKLLADPTTPGGLLFSWITDAELMKSILKNYINYCAKIISKIEPFLISKIILQNQEEDIRAWKAKQYNLLAIFEDEVLKPGESTWTIC